VTSLLSFLLDMLVLVFQLAFNNPVR